jgi:hypothetical protein
MPALRMPAMTGIFEVEEIPARSRTALRTPARLERLGSTSPAVQTSFLESSD